MQSDGENSKERRGESASVRNVLSGSGPGSITLWGRDMILVGVDVPESVGSVCGLHMSNNGEEGKAA